LPQRELEYQAFASSFPFEETPDQAEAIRQVLNDLATEKPMDRVVCGDVGFGKTEVAMRAAFIARRRQAGGRCSCPPRCSPNSTPTTSAIASPTGRCASKRCRASGTGKESNAGARRHRARHRSIS
jgi:hypothetical protein